MTNLLEETEDELADNGYTWADVEFIGSANGAYGITVDHFKKIANATYDSGFGSAEVARDLTIKLTDGTWFSRGEYDGSEWWTHHTPPVVAPDCRWDAHDTLTGDMRPTMKELAVDRDES